jgi:carbon storage regulator CsrA
MLVLSRRPTETLVFPGTQTTVRVVEIKKGSVRLGVEAPPHVEVWRGELAAAAAAPARPAAEEIARLIAQRLGIAGRVLTVLRDQVTAGQPADAVATLAEVEAELTALGDRVRDEVGGSATSRKVHGHRPKALLVEDNPQERELLALILRAEGLDVDTAGDGCDALDYLKVRGRPDLVLLDMGLPRLDGPATVQEIRKEPTWAGLKIFAVSGHAADEYDLAVGPAGVDGWFQKPVDPAAMVRNLSREVAGL